MRNPGRDRKLTEEERDRLIRARQAGAGLRELARRFQVGEKTIRLLVKQYTKELVDRWESA